MNPNEYKGDPQTQPGRPSGSKAAVEVAEEAAPKYPRPVYDDTELRKEIANLRAEILKMQAVQLEPPQRTDGIYAHIFGEVYCPECGLKLDGVSATGPKPQIYTHTFATAPRLGGIQCKLKGKKFLPSRNFLQFV